MRAALDTVAIVSSLLGTSDHRSTVTAVVDAALAGAYDLLLPEGLPDEPIDSVENECELSPVIVPDDACDVAAAVLSFGGLLPYPVLTSGHP